MTGKRRAVTEEQKEERRLAILHAAETLFQAADYNTISMSQIAQTAGVAKGTVFLYFATKEELFLAITGQAYSKFFAGLNKRLKSTIDAGKTCTTDDLVDILQAVFGGDDALLRLMGIVSIILEHNIQYATALQFKSMLAHQVRSAGELLEEAIPSWGPGEGMAFLLKLQALAIGFQHLSAPSPVVKKVIAGEGLEMFNICFADYFFVTIREVIKGIGARN